MAASDQFWGPPIGGTAAPAADDFWGPPLGTQKAPKAAPAIAAPQPAAPAPAPVAIPQGYEQPAGSEKTGLPGPPAPPQPFVPAHRNAIAYQGMGTYSPEFQQAAEQFGREHPLEPGAAPLEPIAGRVRGVLRGAQGLAEMSPPPPGKPRDTKTRAMQARGISDLLGGAFETAEPLGGLGAVAAPVGTAATYLLATGAQQGVKALAKKSGAGPEVSQAAGDMAATVVGGVGAHRIGQGIWEAAGQPEVTVGGVRITPEAPPSGVQPTKPFGEMSDAELIDHANAIDRDPPRNAEWQKQQMLREVTRRQAERRVEGPEAGAPAEGAAGPQPAEGVFWGDPIVRETEADIARQEAEETAKRSTDPVRDFMATMAGVELPPESAPQRPESTLEPQESAPQPPQPPSGSPGEPGVVKFEDLDTTPVPENHVRVFDYQDDVHRDIPIDPNPLTPHTVLEQWGSLKPGQVIDTHEGPMLIVRADTQNSKIPHITVQDQEGRPWFPTKPQIEAWVSSWGKPKPSEPGTGAEVGQVGQAPPSGPRAAGQDAEVYTIKGRQVPVRYEVREMGDLTNSFQPNYPQEYQPRQTDRAGSRQRIEQRKADMTGPLMADSRLASDGAPIILPDGTVITRNHGTQALRELYGENKPRAQDYKQWLTENAEQFGLDPQHVAGMERPVLTRVMTEPMTHGDIVSFAQEANMSSAARMSDAEMASALAKRMIGPLMESFDPDAGGKPNVEFVRGLIQDLPPEEQAVFMDSAGKLSQTGSRMIRHAIFAKAYPDPRGIEKMAESENASLKNITAGMLQAAPQVAQYKEAAAKGDRFDVGLGAEISDAAAVLETLQKKGVPVSDWLAQGSLTGRNLAVDKLVEIFNENRKSAKKIGDVLKEYHTVADELGSPKQQGMFGNPDPVSKDDILNTAYERARANWASKSQKDIFGDEPAAADQQGERGLASRADAEEGRAGRGGEEEEPQALAARKPSAGQEGLFGEEEPPKQNALELAQEKHRAEVEERKAKLTGKGQQDLLEGAEGVPVEGTTREKLLGEQLTAQMKSGMAMKPAKVKPAETRSMFEEEEPETGMLFARRPVSEWKPGTALERIDPDKLNIPQKGKRLLLEDVARYLEQQVSKTLGKIPRNATQARKRERLLTLARIELRDMLSRPRRESGLNWYGKDTKIADRDLAQIFPELMTDRMWNTFQKAISAAMSNNSNPRQEALTGARIWEGFRKDFQKLPLRQPNGKHWPGQGAEIQLIKLQRMFDELGPEGFDKWMTSTKTGREIKRYVPNAGYVRMNETYPGAIVLGPKIGRYFLDIMGLKSDGTTVDVWDVRGQQRRLGRLFDKNNQMIAVPETVFDRPLFTSIHQTLAKEFGLKPKDVQSVLWHYEQALYRALGMGSRSYKRSDGTLAFLKSKGLDRSDAPGPGLRPRAIDQRGPERLLELPPGERAGDRERPAGGGRAPAVGEGQQEPDQPRGVQRGGEGTEEGPVEPGLLPSRQRTPGFYSQLEKVLTDKLPNKASGLQVKAILANPQYGIKADEVKWSGLDDWLKEHPGTVSKQEVMDFVRANNVQLEEVLHGAEPENQKAPSWDEIPAEGHELKFGDYTTPGGTNKRELLLTLPPKVKPLEWEHKGEGWWQSKPGQRFEVYRLSNGVIKLYDVIKDSDIGRFNSLEEAQAAAARKEAQDRNEARGFTGHHWSEPNVVVHIRFDDRTGPNGEKIMLLDENQSDWHQKGRRQGYQPAAVQDLPKDTPLKVTAPGPGGARRVGFEVPTEGGGTGTLSALLRHGETPYDVANERWHEYSRGTGVPDAPWQKTWHELGFRRALRWAAEHGYDKLAWTTGEQQAERYDLSKHIDAIHYVDHKNGTYDVWASDKYGEFLPGDEMDRKRIKPAEIEDFVGKELAQKIVAGDGKDVEGGNAGERRLSGLDLKVGGEGMKGFYDQILPTYAKKYAKKWGAQVGKTEIGVPTAYNPEPPMALLTPGTDSEGNHVWHWESLADRNLSPNFRTRAEAIANAPTHAPDGRPYTHMDDVYEPLPELAKGRLTVHSIDITPAMRKSVMEGQPLFGRKGKAPEQMELFPNHVTTPEMAEHPPARTTAFEVDPHKLPQLQDAPRNKTNRLPDYWKQAHAVAGDLGGRPALFVNNAGMDAFLHGSGAGKYGTAETINGMAVSPELWDQLLENADTLRNDPSSRTQTRSRAIVQVADEVRKAVKRDTPLIVVQTGHTKAPEKIKRVAEEEYDHVSQYSLPGGLRGLPIDRVFGSAEGQLAAAALARNYGYPTLDAMSKPGERLMILAEIGVRLMRPGLYREMDLSTQQALDLAQSFIMGLKQRHGAAAASMVDQFHAAIAKNQAAQPPRSGDIQKQHQESAPDLGRTGPRGPPQVPGDPLSRVGPESAALFSRQPARQPGSPAFTKTLAEQNEKLYGTNIRNWFTGRRDVWQARVNQVLEGLRKTLPDPIDQEALAIYRDFKDRPGELKQFLNGTHEAFGEVRDLDIAKNNIEQLRTPIERAMNPSDALREADQKLTAIAAASLAEGKRVGFIDQHIKPEQYVTHLLDRPSAEEPSKMEDLGRAIGGKMGLYFPYAQERAFPTLLHAAANNFKPRTLNAFTAFQTYGDKFATVRASHLLMHQLHDSHVGMWGVKGNKGIPADWKPLAPHSDIFRKTIAVPGEDGEPEGAEMRLFVPKVIDDALRPITDPDYTARIKGFRLTRAFQAYTKAAQLGLSFFHAISLNYGGLANMGPRGYAQAWKTMMQGPLEPGFHEQELDLIQHGGTTPIQGKVYEKFSSVEPTSFPTLGERIRQLPGLKQVDRISGALTELTFGKIQRSYKVADYALQKAAWLAKNPTASPAEYHGAMRSIAKELNSVYGGLHWENLGVNRSTLEMMRFGLLAPDWAFSNWFQAKHAFEGTPAGSAARKYWLRAVLFGLGMTQAMSLLTSRQTSKRPTQVYMGKDKEGKDIYQNLFFKGAVGDAANLVYNVKDFGAPVGIARTLGNKVAPGIRTAIELSRNETYLGQPIAAKGLNPLVSTIRATGNIATGLAPIPWSAANIAEMMMNRDKYNLPAEALTTLFAGTPPAHVKAKPEKETQTLWEQMKTGKPYAPAPKRGSEEEKLGRELQRLTR